VTVVLEPDNISHDVVINSNMQIWQIIIQASRAFNLKIPEFQITTKRGSLAQNIYFEPVSSYNI